MNFSNERNIPIEIPVHAKYYLSKVGKFYSCDGNYSKEDMRLLIQIRKEMRKEHEELCLQRVNNMHWANPVFYNYKEWLLKTVHSVRGNISKENVNTFVYDLFDYLPSEYESEIGG